MLRTSQLPRHTQCEGHESSHPRCICFAGVGLNGTAAARRVPDASQDLVFVDADHSYAAVKEDLRVWAPKVRPEECSERAVTTLGHL